MIDWSTDKIVGTGLVAALMLSILVSLYTGNGVELQTTIASGLIGFMGRVAMEHANDKSKAIENDVRNKITGGANYEQSIHQRGTCPERLP